MKNIYSFDKIEVLKADGCTASEAKKFLEKGAAIYTPEDYFAMLAENPEVAEEMGITGIQQILERCKTNSQIGDTNFLEFRGIPCVIEYIL